MKKVYISRNYKDIRSAGGKAKTDIEAIIQTIGYKNIGLDQSLYTNKVIDFTKNLLGVIKATWCMPRKGILFMQYPMKKYYSFLCSVAHFKKTKVITVIHDLGTFRRKRLTIPKEIKRLNHSDYIIAQNPVMKEWLKENGYEGILGTLEVFDYLSNTYNTSKTSNGESFTVNYAGALQKRKNGFLYKIDPYINNFDFHLYGNGFQENKDERLNSHFIYKGFCPSEKLIESMKGDFGLVWDGDSIDTCSGNFGIYLKYNSPHKISLYIRSHLPVIIWKEAAMAGFIKKEQIGFTVESLTELDDILAQITIEKYNQLKENTQICSERLASGYYIKNAINRIEECMN